jgi:hypothetical protein
MAKRNWENPVGYTVWTNMKSRCSDPNCKPWPRYGGRGITVCDSWKTSFQNFWRDMGLTYKPGLSIDRIDNDGNYEPNNCRWSTRSEQSRNICSNHLIKTPWGRVPVVQAAELAGITVSALNYRMSRNWPYEKLFLGPHSYRIKNKRNRFVTYHGDSMTIAEAARISGVKKSVIRWRLERGRDPFIRIRG